MSEGHAAPAPAPAGKPAATPPVDPIEELARKIFIELSAQVHGNPGEKPEHKKLVELSFRLAEAFQAGNLEFNTAARARGRQSQGERGREQDRDRLRRDQQQEVAPCKPTGDSARRLP